MNTMTLLLGGIGGWFLGSVVLVFAEWCKNSDLLRNNGCSAHHFEKCSPGGNKPYRYRIDQFDSNGYYTLYKKNHYRCQHDGCYEEKTETEKLGVSRADELLDKLEEQLE